MAPPRVLVTIDHVQDVIAAINDLVLREVLVGVPEDKSARKDSPVNNAQIAYWMNTGMPEHNVPARPTLIPAIRESMPQWLVPLRAAVKSALNGDASGRDQALNAAGILALNAVKNKINSNVPPPLAPSTIRQRKYARQTASRRPSEDKYFTLLKTGMSPGAAQDAAGIISLVNTGAYRDAHTYVVAKRRRGR